VKDEVLSSKELKIYSNGNFSTVIFLGFSQ